MRTLTEHSESAMLTRALDALHHTKLTLPEHLATLRRCYGHKPEVQTALSKLGAALEETAAALKSKPSAPLNGK
jgi:hypothetical protein